MVLEGILSIQAGDNPRIVSQKLLTFVSPAEREAASGAAPSLKAVPDADAAAA
jgi:chemotaxis protein MotA